MTAGPENLEWNRVKSERVDESLYAVNMYEERRSPHLLSGGQKQRMP